jgi:hypothetical protein
MQQDLTCLDELIADLGGSSDAGRRSGSPCDLLLEHLDAARRNLLGSMPGEYRLSLQQAKDALACISDKNKRAEIKKKLQSLIDSEVPKRSSSPAAKAAYVLPGPIPPVPAI